MVVALAAFSGAEIELKSDRIAHGRDGGFDSRFRKDSPSQIGMKDDAGQVEKRAQTDWS